MQDIFTMNADNNCPNEAVDVVNELLPEISISLDSLDDSTCCISEEPHKKNEYKEGSAACLEFVKQAQVLASVEERIRFSMDFMKSSLACPGTPRFRDFWDVRRFCLPLFKQALSAKARAELWKEYVDLSTEARRLKEVLDEQSAFAFEQIDLAIQALSKDLESYDEMVTNIPSLEIPSTCSMMIPHAVEYQEMQRNLQVLNTFALKINSLRKEVIRTEMRVKNKNKLFEKLSSAGDGIFPKRKHLIKDLSDLFMQDVLLFVNSYFVNEASERPALHQLREEIKALQMVAKSFTLNVHAFTETRLKLSECWDRLKAWDKERKKDIFVKKQALHQNIQKVTERIQAFEVFCAASPSIPEVAQQFEEIFFFMRTLEFNFYEKKMLKADLVRIRKPVVDKERELLGAQDLREKEAGELKRKQQRDFTDSVEALVASVDSLEVEILVESRDLYLQQLAQMNLQKADKMLMDRLFKQIKDVIEDKKSHKLLSLSASDKEKHGALLRLLMERRQRRAEIKLQIDAYRKILAGSGFDFEKAIMYTDLVEEEKVSLTKINHSIDEIEEKIATIEG